MNAPQSRALGELLDEIAARRPKRLALVFKVMQRKLPEQVL